MALVRTGLKNPTEWVYTCDENGCVYYRTGAKRSCEIAATEHPKSHMLSCGHMPSAKCVCDTVTAVK